MAAISSAAVTFSGTSVSDHIRSSSNGVCGIPLKSLGKVRLGVRRGNFTVLSKLKKGKKHDYPWPDDADPNVKGGVLYHLSHFKPLKENPKPVTLEFEKPLLALEKKINDVRNMANETGLDFTDQILSLENKYQQIMDHHHRLTVKLDGKNYMLWASYLRNFLEGQELWGYIDGSAPRSVDGVINSKWTTNNAKIKTWIMESVDIQIVVNLSPLKTAKDMWEFLDRIYKVSNEARLYQLEHEALKDLYTHLTPIQRVNIARHPNRPTFLDHVFNITEKFVELHGDRAGYDDPAIVTGIGTIDGKRYMFIGHQKGRNTKENIQRNFGMPTPHGYRKALRMMYYADHHRFPIVTFIDTPGAYADLKSEELGQGEAIAHNLRTMFGLKVPILSIVIGEGGSGGALAIGCANKLLMLENAVFYVASPEACAAILWKTAKASPKAAEKLKITAGELCKLQVADGVIPEPLGGAHADSKWTSLQIKNAINETMDELMKMNTEELLKHRMLKFRKIGGFQEGIPIDPKRKVNMKKKEESTVGKTSAIELEGEIDKLKQQILKAGDSDTKPPMLDMNEMIQKLKREVDLEYSEAVEAIGLKDKLVILKEEFSKAKNSQDQRVTLSLKDKFENLKNELDLGMPFSPNYKSLMYKLDMLKEITKAKKLAEQNEKASILKQEVNRKFKEVLDRPDVQQKFNALKADIENSGASTAGYLDDELKEKIANVKREIELELANTLKSLNLDVGLNNRRIKVMSEKALPDLKDKVKEFNKEINQKIGNVVGSSDLKKKIDLLKMEIIKAGKAADSETKKRIETLEQQIKHDLAELVSSSELKAKYEKLTKDISEAATTSGGLNESIGNNSTNYGDSKVERNLGSTNSFL